MELSYPRTLTWSLDDYAAHIEAVLGASGITEGWLLGESFGSQVLWALLRRGRFRATGVVLAGGFVRHPARWLVRLAERFSVSLPFGLFTALLRGYGRFARFRYRRSPEVTAAVSAFIERRTDLDRHAAKHRLRLIATDDLCATASQTKIPVYALTGSIDPVVPWYPVRRWLQGSCPALRDYKILWRADHTVLATAPPAAAEQVLKWISTGAHAANGG